jgi:ribonucleoside-diphosphate reductase alpha chain
VHQLIDLRHGGFDYVAGIGRFKDGRLAEIFLNAAKTGTAIEATARDAAILVSLALQHGVTPTELRHALTRNADGTASGPVGALLDLLGEPA